MRLPRILSNHWVLGAIAFLAGGVLIWGGVSLSWVNGIFSTGLPANIPFIVIGLLAIMLGFVLWFE